MAPRRLPAGPGPPPRGAAFSFAHTPDGTVVGCDGLCDLGAGVGEVKHMYVEPGSIPNFGAYAGVEGSLCFERLLQPGRPDSDVTSDHACP
ncbi:hypothetical protein [Streptomyces abikoensis]|uniref:hypothetical protein n=1 Tax=Streptomyces abikoensis TaxID=97398 RepID=UPI0019AAE36D|nr:hypothetical protein [Streptomyces abikoensis]GGP53442.1 hypothetical protein GCM10010214_28310 [Streptomyces abikoensis]